MGGRWLLDNMRNINIYNRRSSGGEEAFEHDYDKLESRQLVIITVIQ